MGWLDAAEAKEVGLVATVIASAAEPLEFPAEDVAAMTARGLAVAALFEAVPEQTEAAAENAEPDPLAYMAEVLGIPDEAEMDAIMAAISQRCEEAYDEGEAAGKAAALAELGPELTRRAETAEAEVANMAEEVKSLSAENAKLAARVTALDAGFRGGGNASEPGPAATGASGYWDAVKELVENGTSKNQAILTVQRENPELYAAMLAESNRPKQQKR